MRLIVEFETTLSATELERALTAVIRGTGRPWICDEQTASELDNAVHSFTVMGEINGEPILSPPPPERYMESATAMLRHAHVNLQNLYKPERWLR